MLFSESGLACFSPSVTPTIRKLWVKNGGTLTHTDDDFRKANYFFCDGMDDPWLNELLSRRLIVRHASWVTLCVVEDFRMPIAAYTLDDGFDVTKIRIIEPPSTRRSVPTEAATTIGASTNSTEAPADILDLKKIKAVSRKRPFDNMDDSSVHKEEQKQRPRKKARVDVHALVFPELYDPQPCPKKKPQSSARDESVIPRFSIFPKPSGKVSRAVNQRFLSQTRQTAADEPNDNNISTLNPFSLFWNDLLETHLSGDSTEPLTLSVEDLLQAPRARATIFAVNTDYLGRTFVNLGPASQRVSPP